MMKLSKSSRTIEGYHCWWYQGHGEIGPRALGNRSILMNPMIKMVKIF